MIDLRDNTFDKFIASGTSLIMFGTSWCKACIPGAKRLKEFEEEHQIKTGKVDLQMNPAVMKRYLCARVPFFILFQDGEIIARHQGNDIQGFERYLKGGAYDSNPP